MKKLRVLIYLTIALCALAAFALAGCSSAEQLHRPTGLSINSDTLELSWSEVTDALRYTVRANDSEFVARSNSYSLTGLPAGEYEISVKACSNGVLNSDSDWSASIRFTREEEPGMVFSLINGGTEYAVTGLGSSYGDIVIPEEYRGKPVTAIGERAFTNRPRLTGITLHDGITSIGAQAFAGCSYLKTITLPAGLTHLGASAFYNCRLLEGDLVVPDGVTSIGDMAFQNCASLTSITLGQNVVYIGEAAFYGCSKLTEFTIPDSVTSMGIDTFGACANLARIVIGDGLTELPDGMCYNCVALTDIVFGGSVTVLGAVAFRGCTALTRVVIPNSVEEIGAQAFLGCTALTAENISFGGNVKKVQYDAFTRTAAWDAAESAFYLGGWLLDIKNPTELTTITVTDGTIGIGGLAFYECNSIQTVILPDSVLWISDHAFYRCETLTNVVIGSGAREVGRQAFYQCPLLRNVILGSYDFTSQTMTASSLERIGSYAFAGCETLSSIEIPDTVTFIGSLAFRETAMYSRRLGVTYAGNWAVDFNPGNWMMSATTAEVREGTVGVATYAFAAQEITSASLPEGLLYLGHAAFANCTSLLSVTLPSELEEIPEYMFYNCASLLTVEFPAETLLRIGRSAFYNCFLLGGYVLNEAGEVIYGSREATLTIPDSVRTIEDFAFYNCGIANPEEYPTLFGAETLIIGDGVRTIGSCAFSAFDSLKRVTIGANVRELGEYAFYGCSSLEEVTLGGSLNYLSSIAFYGCSSLKSIVLADNVTEIDDFALYGNESIVTVTAGAGLQRIGDYAFYGNRAMQSVFFTSNVTSIGTQAFRDCESLQSVILGANVTSVGGFAFYGCDSLTIYAAATEAPAGWVSTWNCTFRPVVWGCTLSADGSYVVSFTKTASAFSNLNSYNRLAAPLRTGYVFSGWTSVEGGETAEYTAENVTEAPDGVTLYAIWTAVDIGLA